MRAVFVVAFAAASVLIARPVAAAAEYDSVFAGESAFLSLVPGQSGSFTVFFLNNGSTTWVKGSGTQVDLAACLDDQVTCDIQDRSEAVFDPGTWLSARRYATQSQPAVAPGAIGTFSYTVRVPSTQPLGRHRFNGELVVAATGRPIHPEGYYQDLMVQAPACAASAITAAPDFAQVQLGLSHELRVTVTCPGGAAAVNTSVTVSVPAGGAGNPSIVRTVTTDASGVAVVTWSRSNPVSDRVSAYITASPTLAATAVARWTVAAKVLECAPTDQQSLANGLSRVFTVTLRDADTAARVVGGTLDLAVSSYISLGTATINGVSAVGKLAGFTVTSVTTDSGGVATLSAGGTDATVKPLVFLDEDSSNALGPTEFRVECGGTTFFRP